MVHGLMCLCPCIITVTVCRLKSMLYNSNEKLLTLFQEGKWSSVFLSSWNVDVWMTIKQKRVPVDLFRTAVKETDAQCYKTT